VTYFSVLLIICYTQNLVEITVSNTGRFIMFSVITNIYNKKTKGPTLMELFTATGKVKTFFLTTRDFNVCTIGDTAHVNTIFKFLPHTRQYGCIDILHCCTYIPPLPHDLADLKAWIIAEVKNIDASNIVLRSFNISN
jgi:hypothetical protein